MVSAVFLGYMAYAQSLYTEDFEGYLLGNLGTDPTGAIPGQGGWLTVTNTKGTKNNNAFTIVNDPVKNKVLQLVLNVANTDDDVRVFKLLNDLIDNRTPSNNVIKFEIDYYAGTASQVHLSGYSGFRLWQESTYDKYLFSIEVHATTGSVKATVFNGAINKYIFLNNKINGVNPVLPFNKWFTFIVYLDYDNKKIYFETPYFNTVVTADFLETSRSVNLFNDFKPFKLELGIVDGQKGNQQVSRKFDNIKITALNAVPPHVLSAESFLASHFSMYPNPASNIVTITNSENIFVTEIAVYDVAGKLIKTENYNNKTEIQLNVEHLASGTYMLHLQTNEGTAVKKLVKK